MGYLVISDSKVLHESLTSMLSSGLITGPKLWVSSILTSQLYAKSYLVACMYTCYSLLS